jgi:hypothetical protein
LTDRRNQVSSPALRCSSAAIIAKPRCRNGSGGIQLARPKSSVGEGGNSTTGDGDEGGEGGATAIRDLGPDSAAVATVAGCNDQDRVARQLCEAATKEQDPFLRAALWGEYNEYKKLVARD